jgi:hypothetical protein
MMERSEDELSGRRGSSVAVWAGIGAIFAPVVYVLSAGPGVWVHDRAGLGPQVNEFIRLVFAPLAWLWKNNEAFRIFIDWYVGLWGG